MARTSKEQEGRKERQERRGVREKVDTVTSSKICVTHREQEMNREGWRLGQSEDVYLMGADSSLTVCG